jgi:segregation and condensation protein B
MEMESIAAAEAPLVMVEEPTADEPAIDGTTATETAAGASVDAAADDPIPALAELSVAPEVLQLAGVVEGLLFAAGAPVPIARLAEALQGTERVELIAALRHLAARLDQDDRGIRLVQVAGAYQLRTATVHGPWIRRLLNAKPPRLSRPMLESLAIVAYRQPCTRAEIEAIRGVDADATLTTLMERRMIRMLGRKEAPGRPILYGTTREFLEVFGLPDLSALPALPELAEAAALLTAPDLTVGAEGVHPTADIPAGSQEATPESPEATSADTQTIEAASPLTDTAAAIPDAADAVEGNAA